MAKKSEIIVKNIGIRTMKVNGTDYLCITDIAKQKNELDPNAVLINDGIPQGERLVKLNQIAIQQMRVLNDNEGRKLLK